MFLDFFFFLAQEAYRVLAPWPGIEPAFPALGSEVLTTHISFLKNPIQLIFLFIFPSIKSYITTSHLNRGNSSEGSILIPIFTVLQTPWVIFRVNLVNLPTYWTNWLFWKIHVWANSFLITESASLWKSLFPCTLATVLVFHCCCNCYNLSSYKEHRLLFLSSVGAKSSVRLPGLKSRCWHTMLLPGSLRRDFV